MVEAVEGVMLVTVIEVASDPRREKRDAAGVEPLEKILGAKVGAVVVVRGTRGPDASLWSRFGLEVSPCA